MTLDDASLVQFAMQLVVRVVEAVNNGDHASIRSLSVLGVGSDRVVSRYCEILEAAMPLRVLSISVDGSVEKDRTGPRWAPWVRHDRVTLVVELESRNGIQEKKILVWLYHLDEGLAGQLASRVVD